MRTGESDVEQDAFKILVAIQIGCIVGMKSSELILLLHKILSLWTPGAVEIDDVNSPSHADRLDVIKRANLLRKSPF
jgi:hypothetical protein